MVTQNEERAKALTYALFVLEEPIEDRLDRAIGRASEVILTNEKVLTVLGFKPYNDVVTEFI